MAAAGSAEEATSIHRSNPETLAAANGYTHVIEARGGRTLYISGQVALDREGKLRWVHVSTVIRRPESYTSGTRPALSPI